MNEYDKYLSYDTELATEHEKKETKHATRTRSKNIFYFLFCLKTISLKMYSNRAQLEPTLSQEYKRLLYINEIKNITHINFYKYHNILNTLFIDMANYILTLRDGGNRDKILIDLEPSHYIWLQYNSINSKRIRSLIKDYLKDDKIYNVAVDVGEEYVIVRDNNIKNRNINNEMKFKISKERMTALKIRGTSEQIAIMVLRYQCLVPRINNWSMPLKYYKHIYEYENIKLEGFSSPLDSQLMLIADDAKFCSLFLDTDEVFGSVGSFFDLDYEPESISLNPPHSINIVDKVIEKTLEWKNAKVIYNLPCWISESYKKLDYNRIRKVFFRDGGFYYESEGMVIMPITCLYMYLLRVNFEEEVIGSVRPNKYMFEQFKQGNKLGSVKYCEAKELSNQIIDDSIKLLS